MMFVDDPQPRTCPARDHTVRDERRAIWRRRRTGCIFKASGCSLPFRFSRISTLPSASSIPCGRTGKFHALIEKLQRVVEGNVSLFKFSHDFFQPLETSSNSGKLKLRY